MNYVNLDNNLDGISVSWTARGTVSIHAHQHGGRPDFYKEIENRAPRNMAWIYFPLARKETITAGWIREVATTIPDRQPALVVSESNFPVAAMLKYQAVKHFFA